MVKKLVNSLKGKDVAITGLAHSGWSMAFQVRGGIEKLLIDMYKRPNLVKVLLDKIVKACLGFIKIMIDGGVEVIVIGDATPIIMAPS